MRWKGKSSFSYSYCIVKIINANTIRDDENDWSDDADDEDIGVGMYGNMKVRARA